MTRRADFRALEDLLQKAIADEAFPAACVLVAKDGGEPVLHQAFGAARLDSVFDLASLTKPLATTATLMQLVARGELETTTPLAALISETAKTPLGPVTLAQLLSHCSGICAWRPFYEELESSGFRLPPAHPRSFKAARRRLRRLLLAEALEAPPGARSVYSDLGFLLLQWALERRSGARLHRLARRELYEPLGLRSTTFVDLERPPDARPQLPFVPTERCPRRGRLCGEVHDDNTHALGGVAGHAGLFSTVHDVHLLVRELWRAYAGERSLFERDVVRAFWRARPARASRGRRDGWALGWDRPSSGGSSSAGSLLGEGPAVGHLGFTGTSVWIDLARGSWVVLLTNRVYYGREPNPMKALRPEIHDAAWRGLAASHTR